MGCARLRDKERQRNKQKRTDMPSLFVMLMFAPLSRRKRAVSTSSTVYNGVSPSASVMLTSAPVGCVGCTCETKERVATTRKEIGEYVDATIGRSCMPVNGAVSRREGLCWTDTVHWCVRMLIAYIRVHPCVDINNNKMMREQERLAVIFDAVL
jgi:hypothetical protein